MSDLSLENALKLGISAHRAGNLSEAKMYYTTILKSQPDHPVANHNLGVLALSLGKKKQALRFFRKAIKVNPNNANAYYYLGIIYNSISMQEKAITAYKKSINMQPEASAAAHNNLGLIWTEKKEFNKAIVSFEHAINLNPEYPQAFNNMGLVLLEKNDVLAASRAFATAVKLKPDYANAYANLGIAYQRQNKLYEALISFETAYKLDPKSNQITYNFARSFVGVKFNKANSSIQNSMALLLEHSEYVRPIDLAPSVISLLKLQNPIQRFINERICVDDLKTDDNIITEISQNRLLLQIMCKTPIPDLEFERALQNIRGVILNSHDEALRGVFLKKFQSALAIQCYLNEFVYETTSEELSKLEQLVNSISENLKNNKQPTAQQLLCIASYKPLNEYSWCDKLNITDEIKDVYLMQISEPKMEDTLKLQIKSLDPITDKVSLKVKDQYEDNPYPRWISVAVPIKPQSISRMVDTIPIKLIDDGIRDLKNPKILIAGCGTGQQSIETAFRFQGAKILAVDLSFSSLAYAQRKTNEYGLQNIRYMQADILSLGKLKQKFDIIECAGVLHHMKNPMEGWKILTDLLRDNGIMKVGLYSELAREDIVRLRKEIITRNLNVDDCTMKNFRKELIKDQNLNFPDIKNWSDFYNLSELRDLLFHVQEHRFTLPQIKASLNDLGLAFCGFEMSQVVNRFISDNKEEDIYNLDKWNSYESSNKKLFKSMYQFWCQKI